MGDGGQQADIHETNPERYRNMTGNNSEIGPENYKENNKTNPNMILHPPHMS